MLQKYFVATKKRALNALPENVEILEIFLNNISTRMQAWLF